MLPLVFVGAARCNHAVLIVLLDCSASMHEGFRRAASPAVGSRGAAEAVKLAVARRALREHLAQVPAQELVVVVAFDASPSEVFRGSPRDHAQLEAALDALIGHAGGDLPRALAAAHAMLSAEPGPRSSRVVVISDGQRDDPSDDQSDDQSDNDAIEHQVDAIADLGVVIDVLLVDPSHEGEARAWRIAAHGNVSCVSPEGSADAATTRTLRSYGTRSDRVWDATAQLDAQVRALRASREATEDVQLTAVYPGTVVAEVWNELRVVVHLERLADEVRRSVRTAHETMSQSAVTRLARGTQLRIEPRLDGLELDIVAVELVWYDDIQATVFRFRVPAGATATRFRGAIDVSIDGALVAELGFAIRVTATALADDEPVVEATRLFDRVFVSYSTRDRAVVEACVQTYRALGIHVHIDHAILHGGDDLEPALRDMIERADLFQLYWSTASAVAPWVEKEWRHAVTLIGAGSRKGPRFIRPLTWEDPPPPLPDLLKHLRFEQLDRRKLAAAAGPAAPDGSPR